MDGIVFLIADEEAQCGTQNDVMICLLPSQEDVPRLDSRSNNPWRSASPVVIIDCSLRATRDLRLLRRFARTGVFVNPSENGELTCGAQTGFDYFPRTRRTVR